MSLAANLSMAPPLPLVLAALLLGLALAAAASLFLTRRRLAVSGLPQAQGALPLVGSLPAFAGNSIAFILRQTRALRSSAFAASLLGQRTVFLSNVHDFAAVWREHKALSFDEVQHEITAATTEVAPELAAKCNGPEIHRLWIKHLQSHGLARMNGVAAQVLTAALVPEQAAGAAAPANCGGGGAPCLPAVLAQVAADASGAAAAASKQPHTQGAAGAGPWRDTELADFTSRLLFSVGLSAIMGPALRADDALYAAFRDFDEGFPLLVAGAPKIALRRTLAGRDHIASALLRLQAEHLRRAGAEAAGAGGAVTAAANATAGTGAAASNGPAAAASKGASEDGAVGPLLRDRVAVFRGLGLDELTIARTNTLLVWALHGNTGPVAFWALAFLLAHPASLAAVVAEVDALYAAHPTWAAAGAGSAGGAAAGAPGGGSGAGAAPTLSIPEALERLPLLSSAVQEAMRLAVSSMGLRVAMQDVDVPLLQARGDAAAVREPPGPAESKDEATTGLRHRATTGAGPEPAASAAAAGAPSHEPALQDSSRSAQPGVAHVTKGDRVMFTTLHHRDESVFPQPHAFVAERFMVSGGGAAAAGSGKEASLDSAAPSPPQPAVFTKDGVPLRQPVLAFGGGVSQCPGRFLALNEIRLALAVLLRHYELRIAAPSAAAVGGTLPAAPADVDAEALTDRVVAAGTPALPRAGATAEEAALVGALPPFNTRRAGLGVLLPARGLSVQLRRRITAS